MNTIAVTLVVGLVIFLFALRITRIQWMRFVERREKREAAQSATCQKCGYDLVNLDLPRCPECGALRGFKVPMSELGLSEDELRELIDRKHRASSESDAPR